jgi:hypothetical protein
MAFAFKFLCGCLYGYIHLHFYNGDDTWAFNTESLEEFEKLKHSPILFITDTWPPFVDNLHLSVDYIFRNLEHNLTVKLLAVFNIFSSGNYYINVLFFNFVLFWGHYWLFKFLVAKYPDKKKALLISIFFLPPFIFWLSGIRGDGFVLFFLSLLFIRFEKWMVTGRIQHLLFSLFSICGIFIFRPAVVVVILPFLAGWYFSRLHTHRPFVTYLVTYLISAVLFFSSAMVSPAFNLPAIIVRKQKEFLELPGKTRFNMEPLSPDVGGFIKAFPPAMINTLLRPYPWEVQGLLQVITAAETILFLIFILISIPFIMWGRIFADPWICGMLFFSFSLFLFIGLTIPFPGAIIRYKSLAEYLLTVGILVSTRQIKKKII